MTGTDRQIKPGGDDEVSFAGISLRAHDGFKPDTRRAAPAICEEIASRKNEIVQSLRFIDKMERKSESSVEVRISLTNPDNDHERWRRKQPEHPASGYSLDIHLVDSWTKRKNIYESYEIVLEKDFKPIGIYVFARLLDKVYSR